MKKFYMLFAAVIWATGALPFNAGAEIKKDVTAGFEVFGGDRDNAKFREYRYRTDGPIGAHLKLDLLTDTAAGGRYYKTGLQARTKEDIDLELETGSYGVYRFGLTLSRMGHNFAFGAKTLYAGVGTADLILDDNIQTTLQGTSNKTSQANYLRSLVDATGETNLSLRRDKIGANLDWNLTKSINLGVDLTNEIRKGARPFGGTFGFGNAVEIPEPIDYNTSNSREAVEYKGKGVYASVSHQASFFNNANSGVRYDNPFRIQDSNSSSGYASSNATGPVVGQTALPPDNMFNNISAMLVKGDLPMHSMITANASLGWMRQNNRLLPVTTNGSVAGYPLPLPREKAEAKVNTALYNLRVGSKPLKKLHVTANYRYDQRDNNTALTTIPTYVAVDATVKGAKTAHYVSYIKRTSGLEAAYDLLDKTSLSLAYENEHASYVNGSASKENENIYKLSLDTRKFSWVDLKLGLEHSKKDSSYPAYTSDNAELPWMRKYYAASRDRNKALAMAALEPAENLSIGFEYVYGQDKFPKSEFGLRKDNSHVASVDAEWAVSDRITVSPFYTYEVLRSDQRNRQWNPSGGIGDPYSSYSAIEAKGNWTLITKDVVHTQGLSVEAGLIKDKLDFSAQGSYSKVNGTLNFDSPVGTAGNDGNAFLPQDIDNAGDSTLTSASSRFDYKIKDNLTVALGYGYQRWKVKDDLLYDGYEKVAVNGTGEYNALLSMDSLYKPYLVRTVYVQAAYRF